MISNSLWCFIRYLNILKYIYFLTFFSKIVVTTGKAKFLSVNFALLIFFIEHIIEWNYDLSYSVIHL